MRDRLYESEQLYNELQESELQERARLAEEYEARLALITSFDVDGAQVDATPFMRVFRAQQEIKVALNEKLRELAFDNQRLELQLAQCDDFKTLNEAIKRETATLFPQRAQDAPVKAGIGPLEARKRLGATQRALHAAEAKLSDGRGRQASVAQQQGDLARRNTQLTEEVRGANVELLEIKVAPTADFRAFGALVRQLAIHWRGVQLSRHLGQEQQMHYFKLRGLAQLLAQAKQRPHSDGSRDARLKELQRDFDVQSQRFLECFQDLGL